jgi:hypothetical protein
MVRLIADRHPRGAVIAAFAKVRALFRLRSIMKPITDLIRYIRKARGGKGHTMVAFDPDHRIEVQERAGDVIARLHEALTPSAALTKVIEERSCLESL